MTKGRLAGLAVLVLVLAWGAFNYVSADRDCDRATDGRMHATAVTAVVPHDWLSGDTTVCRS